MTTISLPKLYSGKVRDLYEIDEHTMLIVASDRLSAFDVILPAPIVGKGEIPVSYTHLTLPTIYSV